MATNQLRNLSISSGETKVILNTCQIKVNKNLPFFKYDVKITMDFGNNHLKELTTDRFDEARRHCATIFAAVEKKKDLDATAYNRASALYSLKKFDAFEVSLNPDELSEVTKDYNDLKNIVVAIKPADTSFQASTNDLKSCLNASPDYQPNLLEVLNILLEREAYSKPKEWYCKDAIHYLISNYNAQNLGGGAILKPGLKTSADVVGDSLDKLMLVVTADIKTVVHHLPQNLAEKLDELNRVRCYDPIIALQGVSVVPTYGKKRTPWTIQAVNKNIKITQLIDGQKIDNIAYFKQQYGITLTRKDLPMIGKRTNERMIWFPAEVLEILPNQSVTKERQLPCHHDTIVRWSSMLPDARLQLTKNYMEKLGLFQSEFLKRFGFEICPNFLEVKANILNAVRINGKPPRDNRSINIRGENYYRPPTLPNWAVINYGCDPTAFKTFKDWIVDQMKQKGIVMRTAPGEINIASKITSEQFLSKCKDAGFRFVFIILEDEIKIHDDIKYYEREYQVVTQIVLASTVRKAVDRHQGVTVDNILLKTVLKNGGIPFGPVDTCQGNLKIMTNDVLYMGIAFSHMQTSGGASKKFMKIPSRIGYSATCSFHPNQVIGDYLYVHPHDNDAAYNSIAQLINQCKETFIKNRSRQGTPPVTPKILVLYIRGYSEGQWKLIEKELLPKIKSVLSAPKSIQLIFILENKKPMERLYRIQGRNAQDAKEANIPAGVCLDHTVMSPLYKSFYLNPHVILKGTARTAKFTVLVNEPKIDLPSIQFVTHAMSFLHSICTSPTGEPALLTIADDCALRGQTVLKFHMKHHGLDEISLEEANEKLTNPLDGRNHTIRYNA